MALNLASLSDVRRFAAEFSKQYSRLDYLCLNAGVSGGNVGDTPRVTEDGFELYYEANYLGHFLLLQLFMPLLKAPDGDVRITASSSVMHHFARPDKMEELLP